MNGILSHGIDEVTWEKHRTMRANGPFLGGSVVKNLPATAGLG